MLTRGLINANATTKSATVITNRNGRANNIIKPTTRTFSTLPVPATVTSTRMTMTTTTTTTTIKTKIEGILNGNNGRTATITSDPGILCFHHCNVKVFCFVLPHICPNCKSELHAHGDTLSSAQSQTQMTTTTTTKNVNEICENGGVTTVTHNDGSNGGQRISTMMCMSTILLPFRLPYPFVRASQSPCAIVLRPTTGDFLK